MYARQPAFPDFEYQNQPEARRKIERDGLVTLGDVGYLDADGYLFLCDRASDMVISGGVNIYPAEIEHVLIALPGVADASLDAERVRAFLRERLAGYKLPRHIEFVPELPRDDNGKVAKRRLRDAW